MKFQDISWPILVVFCGMHVLAVSLALSVPFQMDYLYWAVGLWGFRWLGFTCAVHRYFSHRVCRTSRWFQFLLGVWGTLTMARSPIRFASGHRHHHLHSDSPRDLHSVSQHGFLRAYIGWAVSKHYHEDNLGRVRDLTRYPELVWLNRLYFVPNIMLLCALYWIGGIGLLTYGGVGSILLVWHTAFSVTVLFHRIGTADYDTGDESKNSWILGLVTFGEGWHNNHHANMSSAKLGHAWWQIDLGFLVLALFAKLGLIWDLNSRTDAIRVIRVNTLRDTTQLQSGAVAQALEIDTHLAA